MQMVVIFFFLYNLHNGFTYIVCFLLNHICTQLGGIFKIVYQMPLPGQRYLVGRFLTCLQVEHIPLAVVVGGQSCRFTDDSLSNVLIGRYAGEKALVFERIFLIGD